MITEFLTSDWLMNPQLDYLLFLQNLRESISPFWESLFLSITDIGKVFSPTIVILIIYWCIDAKNGAFLFCVDSLSTLTMHFLKNICCVHRPWVLSNRIEPVRIAKIQSGGYSFPSGHSSSAAAFWGGLAFILRKHKLPCAILILVALLIGFSRNFLGVHTPSDVFVGLLIGVVFIFLVYKVFKKANKDKNAYLYFLILFNIFVLGAMYHIMTKDYPNRYVNGELLIDKYWTNYFTIRYSAWILGLVNGSILFLRFFYDKVKNGSVFSRIIKGIIGIVIFNLLTRFTHSQYYEEINNNIYIFFTLFIFAFWHTGIYPLIFSKFLRK